ncbi:MAG: acyltransferase family protein [Desulfobacterales bacterium]|jgi:1-acyl-sn-glycerol-3-phosphate acyltransferase|nr:acyltransferase family protein [Desulfobacterales bacterium]MCU0614818.1 acyltransferase family protein [Desulfobacterales bacterium]
MFKDYKFSKLFKAPQDIYPDKDPLDLDAVKKVKPLVRFLSRYFRPSYTGLENIPNEGPALLVGNHGIIGFDAVFIFMAIFEATGRVPRGIGDYHLFLDPISRKFWTSMGAFSGTRENAERFLKAGHLVNVYPGGARDAWKGPEGCYKLHWEKSYGFIEVAMKTGAPIILHIGIGIDDTYRIFGKIRLLGKIFGHSKYELPVLFGLGLLPLPVKFSYYISEMIHVEGGPDDVLDYDLVKENHQKIWDIGTQMIADGLQKRKSIWFG